jgi:hypothetical protein
VQQHWGDEGCQVNVQAKVVPHTEQLPCSAETGEVRALSQALCVALLPEWSCGKQSLPRFCRTWQMGPLALGRPVPRADALVTWFLSLQKMVVWCWVFLGIRAQR